MAFTGNEDHDFSLEEAAEWTANYRNSAPAGAIKAHFFGKTKLQDILAQTGCVGIRIYYALNDEGIQQLILVGADADENDLYQGLIAEKSFICPNQCGIANPLNTDVD